MESLKVCLRHENREWGYCPAGTQRWCRAGQIPAARLQRIDQRLKPPAALADAVACVYADEYYGDEPFGQRLMDRWWIEGDGLVTQESLDARRSRADDDGLREALELVLQFHLSEDDYAELSGDYTSTLMAVAAAAAVGAEGQ